ncbi:MAG: hypothetical protein H6831_15080 [Planctomycetes bacterium]|nr:hypothetical protein [Planctomycetota bacterium]MCB9905725.1 hypothetical protein [Planctomycetota bacterium]
MRAPLLACLSLFLVACGSTGSTEGNTSSSPNGEPISAEDLIIPWTPSFTRGALLIADEIRVEGPKGLLEHIATRVVEPHHRQLVETTPDGFQQIVELVDPNSEVEIRSHLDSMQLVAVRRLTILERPGDVRVKVQAVGRVYYKRDGQDAVERQSIELTGAEPQ